MHRFIVDTEGIKAGLAVIRGEELQHLTRVLRLTAGDPVVVFDGEGLEGQGKIKALDKNEALVTVSFSSYLKRESPLEIWLVQGLAKGEKMDYIIQKATELGVKGIIPLETMRAVVKLNDKKKTERQIRWQRIATEAAKQSGRTFVPHILSCLLIAEFLKVLPPERLLFVPWEQGGVSLKSVCSDDERENVLKKPVYVVIGPEGGLEEGEVRSLSDAGGVPITLGPRILRTETAGLAAVAAIMHRWGDLG